MCVRARARVDALSRRLKVCEPVWRKEFATFPRSDAVVSGEYALNTVCGNIYTLRATGRDKSVGALSTLRVSKRDRDRWMDG